jgi:hypothetical protein
MPPKKDTQKGAKPTTRISTRARPVLHSPLFSEDEEALTDQEPPVSMLNILSSDDSTESHPPTIKKNKQYRSLSADSSTHRTPPLNQLTIGFTYLLSHQCIHTPALGGIRSQQRQV